MVQVIKCVSIEKEKIKEKKIHFITFILLEPKVISLKNATCIEPGQPAHPLADQLQVFILISLKKMIIDSAKYGSLIYSIG